jgi:hypothetical protein
MYRLPVSGMQVAIRPPDGEDDLLLHEARGSSVAVALSLVGRVARLASGEEADWASLTVTDFEWLVVALRQLVLGPVLQCGFACPHPGCGERVQLDIPLAAYLAPVRPTRPRDVTSVEGRPGWFRLDEAAFRLPTAGDQAATLDRPGGARLLARDCIEPPGLNPKLRARIERAMAAMAPEVSRPVAGHCPACGASVQAGLHLPSLVVAEFRRAAAWVIDDVHLLASAYGWTETDILALPGHRRQDYARRIRRLAA